MPRYCKSEPLTAGTPDLVLVYLNLVSQVSKEKSHCFGNLREGLGEDTTFLWRCSLFGSSWSSAAWGAVPPSTYTSSSGLGPFHCILGYLRPL